MAPLANVARNRIVSSVLLGWFDFLLFLLAMRNRLRMMEVAMNMIQIQKQHIKWVASKFAVGSTKRMESINASLRIAGYYARKSRT